MIKNIYYTVFDGTSHFAISKTDYDERIKTDHSIEIVDHFENFGFASDYADKLNEKYC